MGEDQEILPEARLDSIESSILAARQTIEQTKAAIVELGALLDKARQLASEVAALRRPITPTPAPPVAEPFFAVTSAATP
jgi:hypothetical protein